MEPKQNHIDVENEPNQYRETKILHIKTRNIGIEKEIDDQDFQTLESFKGEPTVRFRIERNEEEDEPIVNPDGSVSFARTVNVNGIQFIIPIEQPTELPESVYQILKESEHLKNLYRPKPVNIHRVDLSLLKG